MTDNKEEDVRGARRVRAGGYRIKGFQLGEERAILVQEFSGRLYCEGNDVTHLFASEGTMVVQKGNNSLRSTDDLSDLITADGGINPAYSFRIWMGRPAHHGIYDNSELLGEAAEGHINFARYVKEQTATDIPIRYVTNPGAGKRKELTDLITMYGIYPIYGTAVLAKVSGFATLRAI